jgi:hypothetical protein
LPTGVAFRVSVGVTLALLSLAPARAAAAEGELVLGLHPLYSVIKWDERHPSGGGLGVDVGYGLTESLWLRGTLFYTAQAADASPNAGLPAGIISIGGGFLGISWAFDVLRVIPFLDVGVGALFATGAGHADRIDLGLEVGIGADYLVSRRFSIGGVVRYYSFVTNASNIPVYLYAGPRLAWRFD